MDRTGDTIRGDRSNREKRGTGPLMTASNQSPVRKHKETLILLGRYRHGIVFIVFERGYGSQGGAYLVVVAAGFPLADGTGTGANVPGKRDTRTEISH